MSYNKDLFINNVYALAKKQKQKIGELESASGVSVGYFSRLRQAGKDAAPAANLLMAFAQRLSVSVDSLLSFDFTQATEPEQKLLNFMEKLRFETETRRLAWRRDPAFSVSHPLCVNKQGLLTEEEMKELDLPESVSLSESLIYRSAFRPDLDHLIPAAIYRCYFPGKRILFLTAVAEEYATLPASAQPVELELVMVDANLADPIPFVRTDHENPSCLDKALVSLFTVVKQVIDSPALQPDAEAIINDYLNKERAYELENNEG